MIVSGRVEAECMRCPFFEERSPDIVSPTWSPTFERSALLVYRITAPVDLRSCTSPLSVAYLLASTSTSTSGTASVCAAPTSTTSTSGRSGARRTGTQSMSQGCSCDCGHRCWEEASDAGPVDLSDRAIRPLPLKRLRTHAAPMQLPKSLSTTPTQPLTSANDVSSASGSDDDAAAAQRSARAARPAARAKLATQSGEADRQPIRQHSQEHQDGTAQDRWQEDHVAPLPEHRLADEAHDGSTHTSNSHEQESSASESPPTSPASVSPRIKSAERASQGGSVLFGEEGRRIVDSLTTASSFSPAGLFGGLGLATLHPSLAPSGGDRDFPDEEDILEGGDEDSYGVVDRSHPPVEPTMATQQAAMALVVGVGGSNKKKRKIPGVGESRDANHPGAEDAGSANVQAATPAMPVTNSLPSDPRELFAEKGTATNVALRRTAITETNRICMDQVCSRRSTRLERRKPPSPSGVSGHRTSRSVRRATRVDALAGNASAETKPNCRRSHCPPFPLLSRPLNLAKVRLVSRLGREPKAARRSSWR